MAGQPGQYYSPQFPLEIQNLASTYQLGAPMAEYRGGFSGRDIGNIILISIITIIYGVVWIGVAADNADFSEIGLIVFLICLAGLAWTIINPIIGISWRVYIFNQGFVVSKGGQPDILRWTEIRAMWQQITRRYYKGIYRGTTHKYTIERADGRRIILNDKFKKVEALGDALSQQITNTMWPHVLAAYNAGNTITFGRLSVSQQGVSNGREFLPWPSIKEIDVRRGYVSVRKEGKWFDWSHVAVSEIPNYYVFKALTRYILGI